MRGFLDNADIFRALGPDPLEDARHLLPPLALPPPPGSPPEGPHPEMEFVVDLRGAGTVEAGRVRLAFPPERLASLGFPRLWGHLPGSPGRWVPAEQAEANTRFETVALCWDLTALLSEGVEAARDLGTYAAAAGPLASLLGRTAAPREGPEQAARRAARLLALRERFSRSVEMRLLPAGRPFPACEVWRAAYALGMEWGDFHLFHWHDPATGRRLFTLSAVGQPGYFLPERAAQGEGVSGIALSFELPHAPAPLQVYDRMAVALAYFRQKLGGRPTTRDGRELDGEMLDAERDALEETVAEMARAGIAPGSPDAVRFF